MGYYMGDYYRGDYYRGGVFSKVGGFIGRVAGKAGKFVPGVGTAITIAETARNLVGVGGKKPKPGVMGAIERILPFGETGYLPKRRRMNVANPKALRRAIRRAHGFAKLARSVLSFPISRPPKGRPLFKKRRR